MNFGPTLDKPLRYAAGGAIRWTQLAYLIGAPRARCGLCRREACGRMVSMCVERGRGGARRDRKVIRVAAGAAGAAGAMPTAPAPVAASGQRCGVAAAGGGVHSR